MNISKAFDCISHDLLLAIPAAYDIDDNFTYIPISRIVNSIFALVIY